MENTENPPDPGQAGLCGLTVKPLTRFLSSDGDSTSLSSYSAQFSSRVPLEGFSFCLTSIFQLQDIGNLHPLASRT